MSDQLEAILQESGVFNNDGSINMQCKLGLLFLRSPQPDVVFLFFLFPIR